MAVGTKSNVFINFITEFKGAALARGQKQIKSFESSVKSFAKTFVGVYSASTLANYTKTAVAAAYEDIKAQKVLEQQLKNVGLAFEAINAEKFVSQMQATTGILDDELRPSLAATIRTTGSLARSQEIMTLAFDAAAGSGLDYSTAVKVLTQAYVGNTKGLKQLQLGLTNAEIAGMSFAEIADVIKAKFKGAGAAQVTEMDKLKVALADIKENFGKAFITGFNMEANKEGFKDMAASADEMAKSWNEIAKKMGESAALLVKFGKYFIDFEKLSGTAWKTQKKISDWSSRVSKVNVYQEQQRAKVAKDTLARERAIANEKKKASQEAAKQLALAKLSKILEQGQAIFDPEAITLAAAAQSQLTIEERARVKLKQDLFDLEKAINDENLAAASRIAAAVQADIALVTKLSTLLKDLPEAPNPFEAWDKYIEGVLQKMRDLTAKIQAEIAKIKASMETSFTSQITNAYGGETPGFGDYGVVPGENGIYGPVLPTSSSGGIVINVAGSVVAEQDLAISVANALNNVTASGGQVNFTRIGSNYIA